MITLSATQISRAYGRRRVVTDLSLSLAGGERLGIIGANGSGKSTLLRILAGVLRPDTGTVSLTVDERLIDREQIPQHVGLVAPYLNIYDEFTPLELLKLQSELRGKSNAHDVAEAQALLERVGLGDRMSDVVRTFSSGLRQRVLLALAVHLKPAMLLLDEATITLDDAGRSIVEHEVMMQSQRGGIVVIATNDQRERQLCTRWIEMS